jgi:PA14 domain
MDSSKRRICTAALVITVAGLATGCQRSPAVSTASDGAAAPAGAGLDARMSSELQRAADRGNMCSAREAKAAGLTAEYFGKKNLAGPVLLARQEGPLDHAWPTAGQEINQPVRSARWRGWIRPPFSGSFSFHTDIPGAQVTVAGQPLDNAESKVELHAGRYHPIQIELRELPAAGAGQTGMLPLKLSWTTPFGARYILPRAVLYPPSDTVVSTASAETKPTPKVKAP